MTLAEALQRAIASHKSGDLAEADRLYTAILRADPTHCDANHNLGVLAVSLGQITKAIPLFQAAIRSNPQVEQYWLSLINALIKIEQIEKAKETIQKAKGIINASDNILTIEKEINRRNKVNAPSQKNLEKIIALFNQNHFQQVVEQAKEQLTLFPESAFLHNIIAAAFAALNDSDTAFTHYEEALRIEPNYAEALNNMGVLFQKVQQFTKALKCFQKAVKIKPDFADAYINLGIIYESLMMDSEAKHWFKKAYNLFPNNFNAQYSMAKIYHLNSDYKSALETYK